jgi:hypothetical protein
MFCAPVLVFGGREDVGSHFHVSRYRTGFRWYRGRRFPFSCFARPDAFSAVQRASGPIFMFCAPGLIFGGIEGVVSRFHILFSRTHFRRDLGRWVPFSYFALPHPFSVVPTASGPVSCFALPDSFSAVLRASIPVLMFCAPEPISAVPWVLGPVFMFCAPGLIFGGTEGVMSCFHVLRSQTHFWR